MSEDLPLDIDSRRAWLVVVGAFLGSFVTFGVTYTFGIFLKPIAASFNSNYASMSALFTTATVLSFFLAPLTGRIADRVGPRIVVTIGAALLGAGLIMTAHSDSFPLLFVTYGIGAGVAVACVYIPSIAAVGVWFRVRRDIALGIAISGIGCGTLTVAPLASKLIERFGWRGALEIIGWSCTVLLLFSARLLPPLPYLKDKERKSVKSRVCSPEFVRLYLGLLFMGTSVYVAIVFLPSYAIQVVSSRVARDMLVGYIGASGAVGRLGLNALAHRLGLLNVFKCSYCFLLMGCILWLNAHSYSSLVCFGIILGLGHGGIAAMAPAVAATIFGVEELGEPLGILFTSFGIASVVGPPVGRGSFSIKPITIGGQYA